MLLRKSLGFSVLIEKNSHVSGPVQFKPMLFKGQLCDDASATQLQLSVFATLVLVHRLAPFFPGVF